MPKSETYFWDGTNFVPWGGSITSSGGTVVNGGGSVALVPTTTGGLSMYRDINAGTAGALVKASAGQLYGYYLSNTGTVTAFIKLYDGAGTPTSSGTPAITLAIPGTAAANVAFPNGISFASGIGVRATTAVADNDTTAPAANAVVVNLMYK